MIKHVSWHDRALFIREFQRRVEFGTQRLRDGFNMYLPLTTEDRKRIRAIAVTNQKINKLILLVLRRKDTLLSKTKLLDVVKHLQLSKKLIKSELDVVGTMLRGLSINKRNLRNVERDYRNYLRNNWLQLVQSQKINKILIREFQRRFDELNVES